ncbi:M43 family zinc metalloprotease [Flavobacterium sp. DG1-102-2]|uniref:M43 family zinc metalloprotease n=1 Tax=Flavobacterium sp. DG1-102-2 TaxID=3081663 RepID=UPI002948FD88|nr:M43 family zinc metalloprotease [Flavobacterium sp. DG1-102-2]MDV6169391.1 M43 family zinc metalloprotease [Flavobacterium sp. DG1-102-2]
MKRKITFNGIATTILLTAALASNAQEKPKSFGKYPLTPNENGVVNCASREYEFIRRDNNPKLPTEAQFEEWMAKKLEERKGRPSTQKSGNEIMIIPVVVHVIHGSSEIEGFGRNLSVAQIQSQIDVLNEDYRKMEGTNGNDPNLEDGVDTEIQFCLAKIDPEGNITNGIDRQPSNVAAYTSQDDIDLLKSATIWDPEKYLNIWTVAMSGSISNLLGYAQFPDYNIPGLQQGGMSTDAATDGVVINYRNFGSAQKVSGLNGNAPYNLGRTTTHEIGHFLGLRHIWGDQTNCQGTDYCNDTPVQINQTTGCPGEGTDTCPQAGFDLYQDYMDYSNDGCMSVFTANQRDRMHVILANAPRRASLLTSGVCGILSTPDRELLLGTRVYPNPTQNVLNITVENGELPDTYTIYNSIGQLIANTKVTSDANLTVDTSSYSNGIYFIKIDKGAETKTIKFIKN